MRYFSYGSNMSSRRLQKRVPSAVPFKVAELRKHTLRVDKKSDDESAKCDAFDTSNADDIVHGVIYEINDDEIEKLNVAEGLGHGYEKKKVFLSSSLGERLEAFTYYATKTDGSLLPYCWYMEHVIRGAEEHCLPSEYIDTLKSVGFVNDTDDTRRTRELSIYQTA